MQEPTPRDAVVLAVVMLPAAAGTRRLVRLRIHRPGSGSRGKGTLCAFDRAASRVVLWQEAESRRSSIAATTTGSPLRDVSVVPIRPEVFQRRSEQRHVGGCGF